MSGHGLSALNLPSCRSRVQGPNELGGVLLGGRGVGGLPSAFWICSPMQSVQGKWNLRHFLTDLTVLIKCKHFSWPGLPALQL